MGLDLIIKVTECYPVEPSQELDVLHAEGVDPKQCRDEIVDEQSGPEGPCYPEHRAHDGHAYS